MVPKLYNKYNSLKAFCIALPLLIVLLVVLLATSSAMPLARSSIPAHSKPIAIICLIGSICGDIVVLGPLL